MSYKFFLVPALSLLYKASGVDFAPETARVLYGTTILVLVLLWTWVSQCIIKEDSMEKVHVVEKDPYTGKETKTTKTAYEYDIGELKKLVQTTMIGVGVVLAIHFWKGYVSPLVFQSFLLPLNLVDHQLFRIHVLKKPALGPLKRPFKQEAPFLKGLEQMKAQAAAKAEKQAKKDARKKKA